MKTAPPIRAHGKLLITGEYSVLDGALALAVPTRWGQSLEVKPRDQASLLWQSFDKDGQIWLEAEFTLQGQLIRDRAGAQFLEKLLSAAAALRQKSLEPAHLISRLEFSRHWGLGSSSTLTYLVARSTQVDPFSLLEQTQGGSGYDLACARAEGPLLYQRLADKPQAEPVTLAPVWKAAKLVYLGQKQDSRQEIARYTKRKARKMQIEKISTLTKAIARASEKAALIEFLRQHEDTTAAILGRQSIQQQSFADFPGVVKSLGAWGGDFALALSETEDVEAFFHNRGYDTVLPWAELVQD